MVGRRFARLSGRVRCLRFGMVYVAVDGMVIRNYVDLLDTRHLAIGFQDAGYSA